MSLDTLLEAAKYLEKIEQNGGKGALVLSFYPAIHRSPVACADPLFLPSIDEDRERSTRES